MERNQKENYKRTTPFRRSLRYQTIFLGLCYSCNNFGHKAINFKAYEKNIDNYEGHSRINHLRKSHDVFNKISLQKAHSQNLATKCIESGKVDDAKVIMSQVSWQPSFKWEEFSLKLCVKQRIYFPNQF
jgi:hypothetical protein